MTFTHIERVIGALLPKSATKPQWWVNESSLDTRHRQCRAWLDAGYEAFLISDSERVRFKKAKR